MICHCTQHCEMSKKEISTVDEYIQTFSNDIQRVLNQMRASIREEAPDAIEKIAYGMPAYHTFGKPLVYFAAFKHHIGFYATPSGHELFAENLSGYKQGKGSVQFPLDRPIPFDLVKQIVRFRVEENALKYHKIKK